MDSPGRLLNARCNPNCTGSSGKCTPDPDTYTAVPVVGGAHAATGRAEEPRTVEPGTAANDTVLALPVHKGRTIGRCPNVTVVIAVLDPLPDIAQHVVQTKCIRTKRADRRRVDITVAALKQLILVVLESAQCFSCRQIGHVGKIAGLTPAIAPKPRGGRAGSGCIFLFRFGCQSI